MNDVTRILNAIEQGDTRSADKLLPLVYEEFRLLAARKMSQEVPGQTLQATTLVHEAYIRLVEGAGQNWNSRGHFFKAAAEAMRRIIIENARRKKSLKYGGNRHRVQLDESILIATQRQEVSADDLLGLNDALDKLSQKDKIAADLTKLRIFGGLTMKQAAEMLRKIVHPPVRHIYSKTSSRLFWPVGDNTGTERTSLRAPAVFIGSVSGIRLGC